MTLAILQSREQIAEARRDLERRGLSCLEDGGAPPSLWRRLFGKHRPRPIGDVRKSWDVLRTVEYVAAHHGRDARILDQGAFHSETLCILHRMGYRNLTGIDLDPGVRSMPLARAIRWEVGDFLATDHPDASFDVVTSISVIEHGFDAKRLLSEVSRLLAPGGSFIASFDYWPEKIDTSGIEIFGMSWTLFSADEIRSLVAEAAAYGLSPSGDLAYAANERPIHYEGRDYTFGWLVLEKRAPG
jgi:SAM-dependent methyltransferase